MPKKARDSGRNVRNRKRRRRHNDFDVSAILSRQNVDEVNHIPAPKVRRLSILSTEAGSQRVLDRNLEIVRDSPMVDVNIGRGGSDPGNSSQVRYFTELEASNRCGQIPFPLYTSTPQSSPEGAIMTGRGISESNPSEMFEVAQGNLGLVHGSTHDQVHAVERTNERNVGSMRGANEAREPGRESLIPESEINVDLPIRSDASMQNQTESDSDHDSAPIEGLESSEDVGNRASRRTNQSERAITFNSWQKLLPCLLINGTMRFTREQYTNVVTLCNFFNQHSCSSWRRCQHPTPCTLDDPSPVHSVFPSFRTMQRTIRDYLLSKLVGRGFNELHNVDPTKAGSRARTFLTDQDNNSGVVGSATTVRTVIGKTKVAVVPISEYARLDLACAPVFRAMRSTCLPTCGDGDSGRTNSFARVNAFSAVKASECVDDVPLVSDRQGIYGNSAPVGVDPADAGSNIQTKQVEVGDTIKIDSIPGFDLNEALLAEFSFPQTTTSRDQRQPEVHHNDIVSFKGVVVGTWSALRHRENDCDRRIKKNLSSAEAKVMQFFQFNRDRDSSLLSWSLCRPGDSFTLLRPVVPVSNANLRFLVLTHRFLIEGGESSYSLVWVGVQRSSQESSTDIEADQSTVVIYNCASDSGLNLQSSQGEKIPAFRVAVVKEAEGARGAAASDPIPSMGFLADGTRYFIYRFMLFWDGFRITQGKAASANGVYMVSLNLPRKQRVGIASVRVLSLFPPGVCVQEVFARLKEDILKGMTEGFPDYDSSGTPIRIFLDFVCSVGDTPALNETVDVMGHNAAACCHLCRFIRLAPEKIKVGTQEYLPTSRYNGVDVHGSLEIARRDWIRSESLSDCSVEESARRRLGFKTKDGDTLGLHDLCASFEAVRSQVPKDNLGRSILPSVLDPYRSLLIGPDHVLFGVGKDCINAALQLISPVLRLRYGKFAITAMKDCRIRTQNKLLDRESGKLLSMGMSDLYCVLFISEYALCKAVLEERDIAESISSAREDNREVTPISKRDRMSIQVVAHFSRIVSQLCHWPWAHIDGKKSVELFNEDLGKTRIHETQENVKSFLQSVNKLCSFDQSVPRRLETIARARGLSRSQREKERKALISDMKEANLARTQLDHPNLHRLLELTETVLPAVGHITRISELLFEKAHQEMKRAIKQSNMRNPQLDAVNAALINDWKGRLTMLYRDLESEQEDARKEAEIGLFWLLMGREELFVRGGVLSRKDIEMINNSIGPKGTVDAVLEREGRQVMTGEVYADENVLRWKLLTTKSGKEMTSCFEYERGNTTNTAEVPGTGVDYQRVIGNGLGGRQVLQVDQINSQQEACSPERDIENLRKRALDFLMSMYGANNFKHGYEVRPLHFDNSLYPESYGVRAGDIIQALTSERNCANGPFSFVPMLGNGCSHGGVEQITYWFTLGFFEVKTGCGALVLPCEFDGSYSRHNNSDDLEESGALSVEQSIPVYFVSYRPGILPKIVMLDQSCRRVGVMHDCRGKCTRGERELFIRHKEHVLNSKFYLVDRKAGFPPRML